jgi:hypothetical protein
MNDTRTAGHAPRSPSEGAGGRRRRHGRTAAAALVICATLLVTGIGAAAEDVPTPDLDEPAAFAAPEAAYPVAPCDPNGPTAADGEIAATLNGTLQRDMRGHMDAYRTSCARMVVAAVKARGLSPRAATIAITTVIVETHLQNIDKEVDHDSLGLFQQRASWGSRADRLNPGKATNAFLNKMQRVYPNGSWQNAPIGQVCQAVQVSAYPDRYQPQAGDAQIIVDALWNPQPAATDGGVKVAGDFNGDGRDDVAAMYGYASGRVALFTFGANATGGFGAPVKSWEAAPGNWTFSRMKLTTGDANGDGRDDVAAMYGYADGRVALFTFLANPDGGFAAPVKSWETPAGNWTFAHVKLLGGDFNGDGRDDVGAMYGYATGRVALFTFLADATGGYAAPVRSWETPAGNWTFARAKLATGDYNGDGRDDVAAFYGYADDRAAMFTFVADATGGFAAPVKSWETTPGNWYFQHVKLVSGDHDGDGRDDVGAMYGYASGRVALFTFGANATGGFEAPVKSWEAAPGSWAFARLKVTSGDSNGDGRDDVAAFYGGADDSASMFTFGANATGGFGAPVKSWETTPGNWYFAHVKLA